MTSRTRLALAATTVMVAGTGALAAPASAITTVARICVAKCPTQIGFVFCNGGCDPDGETYCTYAESADACPAI